MPGKCFIAGTARPADRPDTNASDRVAVVVALNDHVRPCWYMNELVEAGTSATGARFVLIPAHSRIVPVVLPCPKAVELLPSAPIWGADSVGPAQGTRLTGPPPRSAAMTRAGWPPA